jgi:tetraacyldisaccharide 4'-kinase
MKPPGFWWRADVTAAALALSPIGALYGRITAARMRRQGASPPCPLICIGNFTTGGSGKTPAAIHVAQRLMARGERPVFLTRGYGARVNAAMRVEPGRHGAGQAGDEPLLLARVAPTIVSPDRVAGARMAAEAGASVIIMDDGLQNPALSKSLSIAVIDAATGFGNGLCFPAGPLRAPVAAQQPFIAAALIIGDGEAGTRAAAALGRNPGATPLLRGRLEPAPEAASRLAGRRVIAMAGIGLPAKFIATLEACGAEVAERHLVADHAPYGADELAALASRAATRGLMVATTEKDEARIGAAMPQALRERLIVVPVSLALTDGADVLEALLDEALMDPARLRD